MSSQIGILIYRYCFNLINKNAFLNIYIYIVLQLNIYSVSTAEFRNAFLKTIRQIIRESVRNMSIPTAKPSTNSPAQLVTNTATLGRQTINSGGNLYFCNFYLYTIMLNINPRLTIKTRGTENSR